MADSINLKFKHPFSLICAAPSGSGKTFFVRKLLENLHIIDGLPSNRVLWSHGQKQALHDVPIKGVETRYLEGLPSEDETEEFKPSIIVVDDLGIELENDERLAKLFTKEAHHLSISIFFIVQNLFGKGKVMRTVSLNTHAFALLNSPRDKLQIRSFAGQIWPSKAKSFMAAYEDCISKPYGYLIVNLRGDIPDKYRLYTRIFKDELPLELRKHEFAPIVYVPK